MSKTQLIIFSNRSNDNVRVTLEINGESVNQVDSIKYLGIMMDTKLNSQLHLETRKQKFNQASYNLGSACLIDKNVNWKVKSLLIKTYAIPVIMYGMDVVILSLNQLENAKATVAKVVKKCLGLPPRSLATKLLFAMEITPTHRAILKSKLKLMNRALRN